ncbi:MAG: hypothetical protein QW806_09610 [Nitrososphaerota archaeon]
MANNLLPPKPLQFHSIPNVIVDKDIYEIEVTVDKQKKVLPFYRVSIITTDKSQNPVGSVELFYNTKYIVITKDKITDDTLKKMFDKSALVVTLSDEDPYYKVVAKAVKSLSNPKISVAFLKSLSKTPQKVDIMNLYEMYYEYELPKKTIGQRAIYFISMFLPVIFGVFKLVSVIVSGIKIKKVKKEAEQAEREGEIKMLSSAKLDTSVRTIKVLVENIRAFIKGKAPLNGLLIVGDSGIGKTFTVKKILYDYGLVQGEDYGYIRVVPEQTIQFFELLYKYRNHPIVIIDDADNAIENNLQRQILLHLLESSPSRVVTFPRSKSFDTSSLDGVEIIGVDKFLVKSKYIVISNKSLEEIPANIRTRCVVINYHLNDEEIFEIIDSSLEGIEPLIPLEVKRKILLDLREILRKNGMKLSFRQLMVALSYYKMYGDEWKEFYEDTVKKKV